MKLDLFNCDMHLEGESTIIIYSAYLQGLVNPLKIFYNLKFFETSSDTSAETNILPHDSHE